MDKYVNANAIISVFCQDYMELKKDLPIRPSEMGVLNIIVQTEGPHTPVELSELLDVSKPMISAHISVLEKNGYIRKEASAEDGRRFYVLPTDKARTLVAATAEKMQQNLRSIETGLGAENFEQLLKFLHDANQILRGMKGADQ